MTNTKINSDFVKSKGQIILEYVLLIISLAVITLRTTITEGVNVQGTSQPVNLGDNVYSLAISAVLIFAMLAWFTYTLCSGRCAYRFSLIEVGLLLLCLAVVISSINAANKRAAITNAIIFITPMLTAILLIQILDSPTKIKLVLITIAASAVLCTYQSLDQLLSSNQFAIDQYEKAPQTMLAPLGIQPGSFQQFLFEHRLYSQGVRGFFTTSNSAGSFSILAAFAAIALLIDKLKNQKSLTPMPLSTLAAALAAAFIIVGLLITKSKGAITAFTIALVMFIAYLCCAKWINKHKKLLLVLALLLFIIAASAIITYGTKHDTLPGGSSMLVRWQYWKGAAKIYTQNQTLGVGPGNFAHAYTKYKPDAALESVADPHNLLLSLLAQYGPLGLVAFLAIPYVPLKQTISPKTSEYITQKPQLEFNFKTIAIISLAVISFTLLVIRPTVQPINFAASAAEKLAASLLLYIMPVVVFIAGFILLAVETKSTQKTRNNITIAALFCAVIACLIHNLIDFAIFEPAVFSSFWALIACLTALNLLKNPRPCLIIKTTTPAKIIIFALAVTATWAYFNYALTPVAKTSNTIRKAMHQIQSGFYAHDTLELAEKHDLLDTTALNFNGRLYLQHYNRTPDAPPELLKKAEDCFLAAIHRDPADFKNHERLSDVYNQLAQTVTQPQKNDYLQKSLDKAFDAIWLYPGSAQLRIKMAQIAEKLNETDIALAQYKKAIQIEDAYRNQFQIMYPDKKVFSRLGELKYQNAKQKVNLLSQK
ncbi:MAG: O-antigen ligase family protein [Planctomycetota bacterium]|jgi:hypothetical protein